MSSGKYGSKVRGQPKADPKSVGVKDGGGEKNAESSKYEGE